MDKKKLFRMLPKVDEMLMLPKVESLIESNSRKMVLESIRLVIDQLRNEIIDLEEGSSIEISSDIVLERLETQINKNREGKFKRVINATGTVLHTNLGRAPLSEKVFDAIRDKVVRYSNLEYDIDKGSRGHRYDHLKEIVMKLTGAEDVLVVNNNASAVLLVLNTLAKEKEAVISRGELVEIGGSFRIPEVMGMSNSILKEVGTTNKTHLIDYENAIGEETALLMKVHTSNYRIVGFSESVALEDLVSLGNKQDIAVYEDIGSGNFIDFPKYGISEEPTIIDSIKKGVDVLSFSGDKLLGGVQAGIIVGKKKYIEKMKHNQLLRALRPDKLTLSILKELFKIYYYGEAEKEIPSIAMMIEDKESLKLKAERLYDCLSDIDGLTMKIDGDYSEVGGGSLPMERLETYVVRIDHEKYSASKLEELLRKNNNVPIISRVKDNSVILDVRTLFDEEFEIIRNVVERL
ncbi:MAG: L-seryl-tRNA(Sec) selenium transferase [Firmicutes bacterium]|jgi:L-seryl-tRNA(Ser) seleniumtransferase|nr:L-seryl-tRNA(Sec) selenium transferase [Bacillota bacterium]